MHQQLILCKKIMHGPPRTYLLCGVINSNKGRGIDFLRWEEKINLTDTQLRWQGQDPLIGSPTWVDGWPHDVWMDFWKHSKDIFGNNSLVKFIWIKNSSVESHIMSGTNKILANLDKHSNRSYIHNGVSRGSIFFSSI